MRQMHSGSWVLSFFSVLGTTLKHERELTLLQYITGHNNVGLHAYLWEDPRHHLAVQTPSENCASRRNNQQALASTNKINKHKTQHLARGVENIHFLRCLLLEQVW